MITGVICGAFLCTVGVSFFILKRLKHIKALKVQNIMRQTELVESSERTPTPDLKLDKSNI